MQMNAFKRAASETFHTNFDPTKDAGRAKALRDKPSVPDVDL